jgi:competence protein ComGC
MIIYTVILVIFVVTIIFLDEKATKKREKEKEETKRRCQEYAAAMMESNKQFFEFEEKCREWERKERQIEDLRSEAKIRQKRRAAHKRIAYKNKRRVYMK